MLTFEAIEAFLLDREIRYRSSKSRQLIRKSFALVFFSYDVTNQPKIYFFDVIKILGENIKNFDNSDNPTTASSKH